MNRNAFVFASCKCPICDADTPFATVRNSLYHHTSRDIDLKPTDCKWLDEQYAHSGIQPSLYDMLQCPQCFFPANRRYFENPSLDTTLHPLDFRNAVSKLFSEDSAVMHAVEILKEPVEPVAITYFIAVKRHLLSIFLLENIDKIRKRDSLPIARYYLNLAWLYRDLFATERQKRITIEVLDKLRQTLLKTWEVGFPLTETEALRQALAFYENAQCNSSYIESHEIEHHILQIIGRLHILLGDRRSAHVTLLESARIAQQIRASTQAEIEANREDREKVKALTQKITKIRVFLSETSALIENHLR
jgi:uncharacterized protein (DUF2225 family)